MAVVVGEKGYAGGEDEDEEEETGRGRVVEEDVVVPRSPGIDEHATKRRQRSSLPVGRVVAKVEDKTVLVAKVAVGTREPEGTNDRNTTDTTTTTTTSGTTTTRGITARRGIIMITVMMGTATTTSILPIRLIIPRVDEEKEVGVVIASDVGDAVAVADEVPVHRTTAPPWNNGRS